MTNASFSGCETHFWFLFFPCTPFVCERARLGNYAVNRDASEITPTPPHDILGSCTRLGL